MKYDRLIDRCIIVILTQFQLHNLFLSSNALDYLGFQFLRILKKAIVAHCKVL